MISWKRLRKNIPSAVKVKRALYEVLWSQEHVSGQNYGETRFNPKQLIIYDDGNAKETVHTFFHELLHAVSHEYEINLTEQQVQKLEDALPVLIETIKTIDRNKK